MFVYFVTFFVVTYSHEHSLLFQYFIANNIPYDPEYVFYDIRVSNIKTLNIQTLEKIAVIILKFEQFEPPNDKTNKSICAPSKDSDQTGHLPSLISVFTVCSVDS